MTNKRATKRALLTSVLAICLCLVMLIGSTFAWFTDTASTGVNTITSGKLDIQLVGAETDTELTNALKWTQMVKNTEHEMVLTPVDAGSPLWEPGVTFLTEGFRIKNNGNLALKFKINVNKGVKGTNDAFDLKNVIDFAIVTKDGDTYTPVALENFEGTLSGKADNVYSPVYYLQGHMQESAGNDYQGKTLDSIAIGVVATQWDYEYDSFDNTYDQSAAYPSYPAGVTAVTFPESVDYTTWTGATATAPAVAAYVDSDGAVKYVADVTDAIEAGATTVYLKENTTVNMNKSSQSNRTPDLTKSVTIYANGANFEYGEIAVNITNESKNANFTIEIHDAKNIKVWGNTPNDGVTQNIIFENCHNVGESPVETNGEMLMLWNAGSGTVNVTANNCSVEKADLGFYFTGNGSLTVKNSDFSECATAIKISHKFNGTRTDVIENCTFTKCGCTDEMSSSLASDSAAIKYKTKGTLNLTLNNVAINNAVGTGTIVTGGDTAYNGTLSVTARNVTVDGVAWTVPGGGNPDPGAGEEP